MRLKQKVINTGESIPTMSTTIFKMKNLTSRKFKYTAMDTRSVHCVNKLCKSSDTQLSKSFHYICYKHMMGAKAIECMEELDFKSKKDVIVDKLADGIDMIAIGEKHSQLYYQTHISCLW